MSQDTHIDEDHSVTRQHNRALRLVNRQLRKKIEFQQLANDELVHGVLSTETTAEAAMRRLWEHMYAVCESDDYETIVEYYITRHGQHTL